MSPVALRLRLLGARSGVEALFAWLGRKGGASCRGFPAASLSHPTAPVRLPGSVGVALERPARGALPGEQPDPLEAGDP